LSSTTDFCPVCRKWSSPFSSHDPGHHSQHLLEVLREGIAIVYPKFESSNTQNQFVSYYRCKEISQCMFECYILGRKKDKRLTSGDLCLEKWVKKFRNAKI
ncbi:hypothetical protein C0J52_24924, partial [Blattella germanica]